MPNPTKEDAIRRLQRQLDEIPRLQGLSHDSPAITEWKRNVENAITFTFPESSRHIKDFQDVDYDPHIALVDDPLDPTSRHRNDHLLQQAHIRGLDSAAAILRSMITEVKEYWRDDTKQPSAPEVPQPVNTNLVFLIHGRDHGTRDSVARFLESLGLEVEILEEQADQGLTTIEKFEQNASGGFVVALLTPDDVGGLNAGELKPRARQNVIFELGYFVRAVGRARVRALVKDDVEIPSNYWGVLYISLDEHGGWKLKLAQEMKSAGLTVDLNLLNG